MILKKLLADITVAIVAAVSEKIWLSVFSERLGMKGIAKMSKATRQVLSLITESGITEKGLQALLESNRFTALLREFMGLDPSEPTITPICVPIDYSRTLVSMRNYFDESDADFNDENFPVEARESGERELVLVCFHREISDDEDPAKSELLRELDRMGLQPEGPPELLAIVEHEPSFQVRFSIVARRQVWQNPRDYAVCPLLYYADNNRNLYLDQVSNVVYPDHDRFLASRKPSSK